ncbi:GNAT family N-acetyltransferase [Paenibacillus sp. 19GGS1-52]|uniref:GNAT family N-acetyltransferase n=1 Tax=Paenibacillus sp. 19GGS1-52 TaxID=2758563 RepID=UPI001EFAC44B|nr:GNAT family N-acetyltransferase [Paenibacillus sp. 19GGS1-52]ULO09485.1 GNAT family N-acetyltransferase [Paenibacillus sp. 19GGS1-52]
MMIKLKSEDYFKVVKPLSQVNINTMFAEAVLQQVVPGSVYADSEQHPRTFYVIHPYGMSLLFGDDENEEFNDSLFDYITNKQQIRHTQEWLQADPAGKWSAIIDSLLSTHPDAPRTIHRNTRVNFSFNRETFQQAKKQAPLLDQRIVQIDQELFLAQGAGVSPRYFWRDEDQFLTEGGGYCLLSNGEIASTAFAAFRNESQLEIGIETAEAHRGKGYAMLVCAALIDYCLEHQLEPVWSCRLENEGSYKLAQRLGFEPSLTLPYYQLVV